MKKSILPFACLLTFMLWRCNQPAQYDRGVPANTVESAVTNKVTGPGDTDNIDFADWKEYSSEQYHFALRHPGNWKALEDNMDSDVPVINIYNSKHDLTTKLPFKIQEDPGLTYFAFYPKGAALEEPFGSRISLHEWNRALETEFNIDGQNSLVYMLNDGTAWSYYLKPISPPRGWTSDGFLYIQIGVSDFRSKCFDENGKEKPVQDCDVKGKDKLSRYGTISNEHSQLAHTILGSLYFFGKNNHRQEITQLIKIESPLPEEKVKSPVTISGRARGYWFFEGNFACEIKNNNHKLIAEKPVQAKGKWMTQRWVPFETTLEFDIKGDQPGYLVFRKANPSGQPENDRSFTLPVTLVSNE